MLSLRASPVAFGLSGRASAMAAGLHLATPGETEAMGSQASYSEKLFAANQRLVLAIKAHPLGGGMANVTSDAPIDLYLRQVGLAATGAAPLFTSLTLNAPTSRASAEVHASLRSLFNSIEEAARRYRILNREGRSHPSTALPGTEALGRFLMCLASDEFHVGVAAMTAILRSIWTGPGCAAAPGGTTALVREIVLARGGVQFGMAVHVLSQLLDETPKHTRPKAAAVYGEALERLKLFWDDCWEVVAATNGVDTSDTFRG